MRIYAPVFTRNEASASLLLKIGFTREGCLRKAIKKDNRYLDEYVFSILKDEWRG